MRSTSVVTVEKFGGLVTATDKDSGDFSQLIQAENVQFDKAGRLQARLGFFNTADVDTGADIDTLTAAYLGRFVIDGDAVPQHMFQIDGTYYSWGDPEDSSLSTVDTDDVTSESFNKGTQYGGYIFFTDGYKWDGTDLTATTDYPGTYGPIEVHNERVWTIHRDRLYFSAVGDGNSWPAANFIDVEPGLNDLIVELRSYRNRLYIFKNRSMWILETPGAPTSWSLRRVSDDTCYYQTSVEYEGSIYWFGSRGAYRHDGVSTEFISAPIQDIWDSAEALDIVFTDPPSKHSYCTVFDDKWIVCIEINAVQRILVFHTKLNQWTEWVLPWQRADDSGTPIYIRGMWTEHINTRYVIRGVYLFLNLSPIFMVATMQPENDPPQYIDMTDQGVSDDEDHRFPYYPVVQTKFSDFGNSYGKKRIHQLMLEYNSDGILVQQFDEEERTVTRFVTSIADSDYQQQRIPGIGFFRKLSVKFTLSAATGTGWGLQRLLAKMTPHGQQIENAKEYSS